MTTPKIAFFCLAYNAEHYIRETIESILNQTDGSFTLTVRNNGSTDATGAIIREYMKKDARIFLLENKVNQVFDEEELRQSKGHPVCFAEGEYVSFIDSDDFLHRDYVKKLYREAKKIEADIAVCGSCFFEDISKKQTMLRLPPKLSTKHLQEISDVFPSLYGQFRPMWAKIFRRDFFEQYRSNAFQLPDGMTNGNDTYTALFFLAKSKAIVSVSEALHYYRVRVASAFHAAIVDPIRIWSGGKILERGLFCLHSLGIATPENLGFLYSVHLGHLLDLLRLIKKSTQMTPKEKLLFLEEIMTDEMVSQNSRNPGYFEQLMELLQDVFVEMEQVADFAVLWQSFAYRVYYAYQNKSEEETMLFRMALASSLLDSNNTKLFGTQLLANCKLFDGISEQQLMSVLWKKDSRAFRDLINHGYHPAQEAQCETLQQLVDDEAYEDALDLMEQITAEVPLLPVPMFFRLLLAWNFGETDFALQLAHCASVLFADDEAVCALCRELCSAAESVETET